MFLDSKKFDCQELFLCKTLQLHCLTKDMEKRKGGVFQLPPFCSWGFCHEAVVFFIPLGFIVELDIWHDCVLAYHPARSCIRQNIVCLYQHADQRLGNEFFIDALADHSSCELELELEWCHKAIKITQEKPIAIIIFNYFLCLTKKFLVFYL
jgi:hypothetical protein